MYYLFAESNLANFWETWFHLFSRINGSPRFRIDCVAQRRRKIFKCVLPTWNEINVESSWFDVTVMTFWSPYLLMSKNVVKILVVGYCVFIGRPCYLFIFLKFLNWRTWSVSSARRCCPLDELDGLFHEDPAEVNGRLRRQNHSAEIRLLSDVGKGQPEMWWKRHLVTKIK